MARALDVASTATARVRQLSRGGGRKNDTIDAAAAATIAATQGDARPVEAEDHTAALALSDERRVDLTQTRVRLVNQLHYFPDPPRPTLGHPTRPFEGEFCERLG